MTYEEKVKKVSEELGIPEDVVNKAYKSFWLFIKTKIKELPLKEDMTEEEFSKLQTNFNIQYLGKLSCTYERYRRKKKQFNTIRKKC